LNSEIDDSVQTVIEKPIKEPIREKSIRILSLHSIGSINPIREFRRLNYYRRYYITQNYVKLYKTFAGSIESERILFESTGSANVFHNLRNFELHNILFLGFDF